jgi:hypothetical protein
MVWAGILGNPIGDGPREVGERQIIDVPDWFGTGKCRLKASVPLMYDRSTWRNYPLPALANFSQP